MISCKHKIRYLKQNMVFSVGVLILFWVFNLNIWSDVSSIGDWCCTTCNHDVFVNICMLFCLVWKCRMFHEPLFHWCKIENYMSTCNKLPSLDLINLRRFYMHTNLFHNSVESFTSFEMVDSMCFYSILHFRWHLT